MNKSHMAASICLRRSPPTGTSRFNPSSPRHPLPSLSQLYCETSSAPISVESEERFGSQTFSGARGTHANCDRHPLTHTGDRANKHFVPPFCAINPRDRSVRRETSVCVSSALVLLRAGGTDYSLSVFPPVCLTLHARPH